MMAKSPNSYEELPAVAVANTTPTPLISAARHAALGTRLLGYYVTNSTGVPIALGGNSMTAAGTPFVLQNGEQMWVPMTGRLYGCRQSGSGSVTIYIAAGVG